MSVHLYPPASSLASHEMLFVGFEESFDANIHDFPYEDKAYYFEIINNPVKALHWLAQRVDNLATYQLPYAVFCSLKWLRDDDFRFARQLKTHPDLRFVPLIAFAECGEYIDKDTLIQKGVDDCYTVPVNWRLLEKRLDFLNQFKSKLLEQTNPEQFIFRLSPTKRIFDVVGAALGIVLSAVIWIPVAIAIYLESKGPVIYKSKRVGAGYQVFDFLKFRSMCAGAEEHLCELQHLNQYHGNGTGAVFVKFACDPRVTHVGRFIRKYSLDELPQLINVLRGEMSLVGNRPLPLYEAEMLTRDEWSARFLAPAGITGLWQVTKRGHADMSAEERIALDIAYARSHNLWTDLNIIMRTFGAVVQQEEV
jgi:lipopolysaccharide/colanic/teichoic acid biosynthesis glycosyltransferase